MGRKTDIHGNTYSKDRDTERDRQIDAGRPRQIGKDIIVIAIVKSTFLKRYYSEANRKASATSRAHVDSLIQLIYQTENVCSYRPEDLPLSDF